MCDWWSNVAQQVKADAGPAGHAAPSSQKLLHGFSADGHELALLHKETVVHV
jgi:hypothetical protein